MVGFGIVDFCTTSQRKQAPRWSKSWHFHWKRNAICNFLDFLRTRRKRWFPQEKLESGKVNNTYIYIYIYIRFIDLPKMSRFLPRVQNAERLVNKALARFGSLFCTPWKWWNFTKRYYIKLSFTFHIVMNWNEVWEFNETLLYKAIIHFPRSTVRHENDQICGKALVVWCSVFPEHGSVKVNNSFI